MSQKENENDIWDYKPLGKKTKRHESPPKTTRRKCTLRKSSKKDSSSLSIKPQDRNAKAKAAESGVSATAGITDDCNLSLDAQELNAKSSPTKETNQSDSAAADGPSPEDFCPICQMPFFVLVVQSQRWHVAECIDTPRDTCTECPDGLRCSSTIPNHYKKFNHTLLAHSRASSGTALLSLSQQAETSLDCFTGLIKNQASILETSQQSALTPSALSSPSASPHQRHTGTPQSKRPNGLLLLRSPGPEDFKKKKGWSSSSKSQNSVTASQERNKEDLSIPVKENSGQQASEELHKSEDSLENDDMISYSPLSEFPTETEINTTECRKSLFNDGAIQNEDEDSMALFSDSFSSEDELLTDFINSNSEASNVPGKSLPSTNTQLGAVSSLAPTNQLAAENRAASSGGKEAPEISKTSIQSAQSIVLERLRDTLLSSDNSHSQNSNSSIQTEQPASLQVLSSQSSIVQRSQAMPPQKGHSKAGQVSGLKQTDIGVFFGLKPLREKEKEAESGPNDLNASSTPTTGKSSGQRRQRREGQRKNKAATPADMPQATETINPSVDGRGEVWGRGETTGRRRRWNRVNADGEVVLPRCPFYKKIPGTKFAIDAFGYGQIEGITAYFLTHFHSDHYGGLTKTSTVPIYCNRITGNLVKSKLRVAEQYVHILPMNTEVTVEGVRVILLDANHCPGAAMLLFFLPDGQTVLHTGDFRADPSMETYPELLSCRVQTLYLDTTYCSPEYTFPRQQEVINFAASTAFELVTLNPRTLVVCGSYSVGKEKVFLALAEVLGSKVCLSRDKYNTMCCLESEQIKVRLTTDWKAAQVHVLPMMQLSFRKLQDHLARFSRQYDQLVAFKPTGWTFSRQIESVEDIQPQISGNVTIYGIPYSEHSSFLELKRFVQWLQPLKIIPTVNNGSWANRKAMEKCFHEWLMEVKNKQ